MARIMLTIKLVVPFGGKSDPAAVDCLFRFFFGASPSSRILPVATKFFNSSKFFFSATSRNSGVNNLASLSSVTPSILLKREIELLETSYASQTCFAIHLCVLSNARICACSIGVVLPDIAMRVAGRKYTAREDRTTNTAD